MMKKNTTFIAAALAAFALCIACIAAPVPAYAKHSDNRPTARPPKPVSLSMKLKLIPSDPLLVDLKRAKGRLDYQSKKGKIMFRGTVILPASAVSLGVTDLATASAADVHMELSRGGVVYNDCYLDLQEDEVLDDETPSALPYRVFVKTIGLQSVKGGCGNGIPEMQRGDAVTVYAIVNGVRVNFLRR